VPAIRTGSTPQSSKIIEDEPLQLPAEKPFSVFSYECDEAIRTYLEPLAVGDSLLDMPIFLYPGMCVEVPLEATHSAAWEAVPERWRKVIER
jgi:hypothetical protein